MRKLLNILVGTILTSTSLLTIVSCSKDTTQQSFGMYKDREVELMKNGPEKDKILQTSLFTKMAIINRHENLNRYTPTATAIINKLPDIYKDKKGNNVDLGYYRSRYFNNRQGMPLNKLDGTEDYMSLLDSSLYTTEKQRKTKLPFYLEIEKLPAIPNFFENSNMLNYWYDGGPLSNYGIVKEILGVQENDKTKMRQTATPLTDGHKKGRYELPRSTYKYQLNMSYNPFIKQELQVDTTTGNNFILKDKKYATGGSFQMAQRGAEEDKLTSAFKLIQMAEMFQDKSQSKSYINHLNDFLALSKDSNGSFLASIIGAIYYQNIVAKDTNKTYVDLAQGMTKNALTMLWPKDKKGQEGEINKEKTLITSTMETFFAEQTAAFKRIVEHKKMTDDIDLSTKEGKAKNENLLFEGYAPNLRFADLVYKQNGSDKSAGELITAFGTYVAKIYDAASQEQQDEANNSISDAFDLISKMLTPGFRTIVKSISEMMKPVRHKGLGLLTIKDLNNFFSEITKTAVNSKDALEKIVNIPWNDPKDQEANQTTIANALTNSENPSQINENSFMSDIFKWFKDSSNPVRIFLDKFYFNENSPTRKNFMDINNSLYDYSNQLLLDQTWDISNPKFTDSANFNYSLEYKGQGDQSIIPHLAKRLKPIIAKKGISTYEDLNTKYYDTLKDKDLDFFIQYDGLGNDFDKVHYKYDVTWTNMNPKDDNNHYWVISNIKWFAKIDGSTDWTRIYDIIEND